MYLELQFCNANGLPHSRFLDWSDTDRKKALAFELEKNLRCQMCGTAEWEWEKDPRAYEPGIHQCPGCFMQESTSKETDTGPGQRVVLLSTKGPAAEKRRADAKAKSRVMARDRAAAGK